MNINHDEFIAALNWRYACKKFDPTKKVSDKDWRVLEESLRLSPSSYGLQPWKFIVIQNSELKKKLRAVSWNQSQIEDCSHLVVLTTLKRVSEAYVDKYLADIAGTRGLAVANLEGLKKVVMGDIVNGPRSKVIQDWSQRQAYIAMGNLMNTAAILNLDSCPFEGIEPLKYDALLNLESSEYATVAAVALGYRHAEDKYQTMKKVRFPTKEVFEFIK